MSRKIEKIAIANRGEVAVRIIRACQELGIETVLLHSESDIDTFAYRLADEHVLIGPSEAAKSYLDIQKNINGALSVNADAIHPGFGFLSENADFAEACEKNRLVFVGPTPDSIRLFGDKISAKELVKKAGGPILPGYQGEDQSESTLLAKIERLTLPVMVKATSGGGGRGLRVVRDMNQASAAIQSAKRESLAAFGSEKVFLEKYLDHAKHIEFQIFGDAGGKIFNLFDRECSIQRRHQKIIEEALSPGLDGVMRSRMSKVAVEIAETAKYRGAGTVEFLYQDGEFYFMEMNTRLQVEHPVTEMVLGVDLVKAQILTAQEQGLLWRQEDLIPHGHAIECRIYAEDPFRGGLPNTGVISYMQFAHGPNRRFECGLEAGDIVTSYYDPMIAKVIVWDESRFRAIRKMIETLKECVIFGIHTNIAYLIEILKHPEFVDGKMTTQFIEKYFSQGLKPRQMPNEILEIASQVNLPEMPISTTVTSDPMSPWIIRGNA
ncbi:MAG: pyruvate carboxylase subunit A [Bdellovibrionales bacterium RBG_16_40_8]|nr:MAG: pyruvate carboxylase subunit A [Bdellovibrionales bacterium RBG_16_40_8]